MTEAMRCANHAICAWMCTSEIWTAMVLCTVRPWGCLCVAIVDVGTGMVLISCAEFHIHLPTHAWQQSGFCYSTVRQSAC